MIQAETGILQVSTTLHLLSTKDKIEDVNVSLTHFLPLPTWGHDFHSVIVTQQVGLFQIPGCQIKDMGIIFRQIPFALL